MAEVTHTAEFDARRIATEACAASVEHSAGKGRHNARKWGPCSDHARITREVLAVIARVPSPDSGDNSDA